MTKRWFICVLWIISVPTFAQPDCRKIDEVCIAPNQTRNVGGLTVFRECWEHKASYECRSHRQVNDCQPLRDKSCGQINTRCIEQDDKGACVMSEQTFHCPDKPESTTEKTVCAQSAFCQTDGTGCFATSATADRDFALAAVMLEAAREAGVYGVDPNKVEIFKGAMEQCGMKVIGGSTLKSCCKSSGGGAAFSNYALLGAGMTVANEASRETAKMGSKYMYDALYGKADSTLFNKGLGAMNSAAAKLGDGIFNPNFKFYGFSFKFSLANGFQLASFDPYSFGLQVGLMLMQEWLSCDSSEQVMGLKRGQNLCVHTETYCSKKMLQVCIEKKQRHCCFNSKLAKIINRQGRAQLGMKLSECGGFNQDQLQTLDFSRMDFSEFIADVLPKEPDQNALRMQAGKYVEERVQNYYDQ